MLHREVLERQRRRLGPDSAEVAASINNLGVVLGQRGDWKGAEALHREALDTIRRVKGPRDPDVASALTTVASAMESQGDLAGAEVLHRESLGLRRELLGAEHPDTVRSVYALAYLLRSRGAAREAEALCREALALRGRSCRTPTRWWRGSCRSSVSASSIRIGPARPSRVLRESLELRRRALPAGHWLIASSEGVLGDCLAKRGRFAEAETLLLRSLEQLAGSMGEDHERAVEARRRLGRPLRGVGQTLEGRPLPRQARPQGPGSSVILAHRDPPWRSWTSDDGVATFIAQESLAPVPAARGPICPLTALRSRGTIRATVPIHARGLPAPARSRRPVFRAWARARETDAEDRPPGGGHAHAKEHSEPHPAGARCRQRRNRPRPGHADDAAEVPAHLPRADQAGPQRPSTRSGRPGWPAAYEKAKSPVQLHRARSRSPARRRSGTSSRWPTRPPTAR